MTRTAMLKPLINSTALSDAWLSTKDLTNSSSLV